MLPVTVIQSKNTPRCLQAVTGLHKAGVLHRDIKPDNMLLFGNDLHLNDFDVSCLENSSDDTLRSKVGTEYFWSPHWQPGKRYRAVDDLASLVLTFAWLLNNRGEGPIERIQYMAALVNAPRTLVETALHVLTTDQMEF